MAHSDRRRPADSRRTKSHVAVLAAACMLVCLGYILGRSAAAHSQQRAAVADLDSNNSKPAAAPVDCTALLAAAPKEAAQAPCNSKPRLQIAVAVAVSARPEHVLQLLAMLLPSWQLLRSHPTSRDVVVDLLVFCDGDSCKELPPECRPMRDAGGQMFAHDEVSNCWWAVQDPVANAKWDFYPFMQSIQFLVQQEMLEIMPRYDKIMHTDEDVFLTPRLLHWEPPHTSMFGSAGYMDPFNTQRLPQVAQKYGLTHRGVTNICATWLAPPQLTAQFATLTLEVARKMWDNEWNMTLPGLAEQVGKEGWSENGKWPEWWKFVIALYSAELAINHLLPDIQQTHVTREIDEWSFLETPIDELVHIHCGQSADLEFSKWNFRDSIMARPGRVPTAERRAAYDKEPLAPITDSMPAQQYAIAVAQQALRSAAAVAMFSTS